MQCVVLAGGLGTRMWPVARAVPKTLLPVAGRPFADWQLGWLRDGGVTSVVYCIGYLGERVRDFVGDGAGWGLEVAYVDEGEHLRGTGGALRLALDQERLDDRFLVVYGDSWLQVDPGEVFESHRAVELPATMTVFENRGRWDGSNVVLADGLVVRYEKNLDPLPAEMHWIDYGLSALDRAVVAARIPPDGRSDLADLFTGCAVEGLLAGFEVAERFYEIGSPSGLAELEALLANSTSVSGTAPSGDHR